MTSGVVGLIRTSLQVIVARVLAGPVGASVYPLLDQTGVTEERLADWLTVVVLGVALAVAKAIKSTDVGARLIGWVNLVLSLGRSAVGPTYEPKHVRP